ncbi:uncharacterized protein LOC131944990 [Physella acuta]|uniref:uncharacterized protein LOC131944990 n=1 Tax=Physella acuta TaxID=109671 RepID=UPI0027DCF19F|nr:uncharacterized protein LOC131944990 [Physella acuta]XP_059161900.1 uncharacterized protein LOC131944990 [Physella acuta]XP_059161901.1 uncharacterized protein LOC131944990 [Physella acuta]
MVFCKPVAFALLVCVVLTEAITFSPATEAVTSSLATGAVTVRPSIEAVTSSPETESVAPTESVTPRLATDAVLPGPATNATISKACKVSYAIAKGHTAVDDCKIMEQIQLGMTFYRLVVSIMYCTEKEFNLMKINLCGQPSDNLNQSSPSTVQFYKQLSILEERCILTSLRCIVFNPLAIIFKQLELYCEVLTTAMNCSGMENCYFHRQLLTAACRSTHSKPFATAIITRKLKCRNSLRECLKVSKGQLSPQFRLMTEQKYCDMMLLTGPNATQTCLLDHGCTAQDVNALKTFACNGSRHLVSVVILLVMLLYSLQAE